MKLSQREHYIVAHAMRGLDSHEIRDETGIPVKEINAVLARVKASCGDVVAWYLSQTGGGNESRHPAI